MAKANGTIVEVSDNGGETLFKAAVERELLPLPGQYFMLSARGDGELLPATVFPVKAEAEAVQFVPISAYEWHVGQEIALRGPLGKGFTLANESTKFGLIARSQKAALVLLPLARWLLENGREVALATDAQLYGLPMDLEILPGEQALEINLWADAAALAITRSEIAEALNRYSIVSAKKMLETLILEEFPCGGMATCEVCAVSTKRGWKTVCKDGPVFDLTELAAE